jgi:centromere protein X
MPPKQTAASTSRASGSVSNRASTSGNKKRPAPQEDDEEEETKTIPPELLTRLLHESFTKDGTRITKDANAAVAKYMDVFVREAIARSVAEREGGGFLEVSRVLWKEWSSVDEELMM